MPSSKVLGRPTVGRGPPRRRLGEPAGSDDRLGRDALIRALDDEDETVRQAALNAVSAWAGRDEPCACSFAGSVSEKADGAAPRRHAREPPGSPPRSSAGSATRRRCPALLQAAGDRARLGVAPRDHLCPDRARRPRARPAPASPAGDDSDPPGRAGRPRPDARRPPRRRRRRPPCSPPMSTSCARPLPGSPAGIRRGARPWPALRRPAPVGRRRGRRPIGARRSARAARRLRGDPRLARSRRSRTPMRRNRPGGRPSSRWPGPGSTPRRPGSSRRSRRSWRPAARCSTRRSGPSGRSGSPRTGPGRSAGRCSGWPTTAGCRHRRGSTPSRPCRAESGRIDADIFTFLKDRLDPARPATEQTRAADLLAAADLSVGQMADLARRLADAGPLALLAPAAGLRRGGGPGPRAPARRIT